MELDKILIENCMYDYLVYFFFHVSLLYKFYSCKCFDIKISNIAEIDMSINHVINHHNMDINHVMIWVLISKIIYNN